MFSPKRIKESIAFYSRHNPFLQNEIRKISQWDALPVNELKQLEHKKALLLIREAADKSPFYKNLYSSYDLHQSFDKLYHTLPVIDKNDVRGNQEAIAALSFNMLKKAETSGTSGTPLVVYRSPRSIFRENAYVWYFRMMHGFNIGEPVISLRGTLDNKKMHDYNKAENTLYLSSYLLSKANIKKYAQLIKEFAPKALNAYPSTAFTLANLLSEAGIKIHIPLTFTSSETLYSFQREKIEHEFNGKLFDWYGTVERSMALGQCKFGNYHTLPLYSLNEFTSNGVISTSLINSGFPLIKYYLDDTFTELSKPCECGKQHGVHSIEGRFDDAILLSDGSRITRMSLAFKGYRHLKYSQIIQDDPGSVMVNIVADPGFTDEDEKGLLHKVRVRLDDTIRIKMNRVAEHEIIRTKSGKYKLVISRCLSNTATKTA